MRILLAPDKFKGCLTAPQVAAAMEAGLLRARPDAVIDRCPLADGGEGTVDALVNATAGRFISRRVTGPLLDMKVDAKFGFLGDRQTAVIEMAAAAGLALLQPQELYPMHATTFGVGELMMAAVELGAARIILGIGGSATIDGGIGCAQACGLPVILQDGQPLSPTEPLTAADLDRVVLIKHGRGSPIDKIKIDVACDVANPLFGDTGAAKIYGPQKGASQEQIQQLDIALMNLARRTGKLSEASLPGAGAAGGLGFAMAAFFDAKLNKGVDIVMDAVEFRRRLASVDLCLTGEGRLDHSTLSGKVVAGVAAACREANVPCIILAGSVQPGVDLGAGTQTFQIAGETIAPEESMRQAEWFIAEKAEQIARKQRP